MNFVDKHLGKIGFVLGTGPSLRNVDPDLLKNHITIAVNGAILKAPKADYYFSCDYGMVLWNSWLSLKHISCDVIMACNVGFCAFEHRLDRKVFEDIDISRRHYLKRKEGLEVDKNPIMMSGSSSVHSAIHFAHLLGCSPIVLAGCDCGYIEGKKHYWDFPNQPKEGLRDPDFDKYRRPLSADNPGGKTDGELRRHLGVWRKLKDQNPNLKIIDASGGNLKMFPSITIQEVLNNHE